MNKAGIQGYAPIRVMNNTPPIRPAATVPITSSDTNMRSPSHPDGHRHLTRVTPTQTLEDHFTVPSNLPIMAPQMWNTQAGSVVLTSLITWRPFLSGVHKGPISPTRQQTQQTLSNTSHSYTFSLTKRKANNQHRYMYVICPCLWNSESDSCIFQTLDHVFQQQGTGIGNQISPSVSNAVTLIKRTWCYSFPNNLQAYRGDNRDNTLRHYVHDQIRGQQSPALRMKSKIDCELAVFSNAFCGQTNVEVGLMWKMFFGHQRTKELQRSYQAEQVVYSWKIPVGAGSWALSMQQVWCLFLSWKQTNKETTRKQIDVKIPCRGNVRQIYRVDFQTGFTTTGPTKKKVMSIMSTKSFYCSSF